MILKILVIGLKCYDERELQEIIFLAKENYKLKKLPSSDHYLLCVIPDNEEVEIMEEMEEISKSHGNPAWEIITRTINSQAELTALPTILYYENAN